MKRITTFFLSLCLFIHGSESYAIAQDFHGTMSKETSLYAASLDDYVIPESDASNSINAIEKSVEVPISASEAFLAQNALSEADGVDDDVDGSNSVLLSNDTFDSSFGTWGQNYGDLWWHNRVHAEEAWAYSRGEGITVAVIDSGLYWKHLDIANNVFRNISEWNGVPGFDDDGNGFVDDFRGWDFRSGDNSPIDNYGHGTHVAGIIGAVADNLLGISGIAPSITILPIQVSNSLGQVVVSSVVNAIHYAVDMGAHVINMSLGFLTENLTQTQITDLEGALQYARDNGSILVAAAGNEHRSVDEILPGGSQNVISVGATKPVGDAIATFSNYGADLVAPGVDILSLISGESTCVLCTSYPGRIVETHYQNNYMRLEGTSMASPMVAGAAALMLSYQPFLTFDDIKRRLLYSAEDLGAVGPDDIFGAGMLDILQAISTDYFATGETKTRWFSEADSEGIVRLDYDLAGRIVRRTFDDGSYAEISYWSGTTNKFEETFFDASSLWQKTREYYDDGISLHFERFNNGDLFEYDSNGDLIRGPLTGVLIINAGESVTSSPQVVLDIKAMGGNIVGDMNMDGAANAADYVLWRKALGWQRTNPNDTHAADLDEDGDVDNNDYLIWRGHFGNRHSAVEMSFSEDGVNFSPWEVYQQGRSWTFSEGDGAKTIYLKFRDAKGTESYVVSSSIVVDTQPPSFSTNLSKLNFLFDLENPSAVSSELFASSMAEDAQMRILSGAPGSLSEQFGRIYLIDGNSESGTFGQVLRTIENPFPGTEKAFGKKVAFLGTDFLISAPGSSFVSSTGPPGSVHLFDGDPSSPSYGELLQTFQNPVPATDDKFGWEIAQYGKFVFVSAPNDSTITTKAGSVFMYDGDRNSPNFGTLLHTFRHPDPGSYDQFGYSIATVGGNLLIGAPYEFGNGGAAYLFDADPLSQTFGTLLHVFENPMPGASCQFCAGDRFGISTAVLADDYVMVGASYDDAWAEDAGVVYMFDANPNRPTFGNLVHTFLNPNPSKAKGDNFGDFMTASNNRIYVFARGSYTGADWPGIVYVFNGDPNDPKFGSLIQTIQNPDPQNFDSFGNSFFLSNNHLFIGSQNDDKAGSNAGAFYVYDIPLPELTINNGQSSTSNPMIELSLFAEDLISSESMLQMSFSIDGGNSFSPFEPYSPSKYLTLQGGNGQKIVVARVRDVAGNQAEISGTILLTQAGAASVSTGQFVELAVPNSTKLEKASVSISASLLESPIRTPLFWQALTFQEADFSKGKKEKDTKLISDFWRHKTFQKTGRR